MMSMFRDILCSKFSVQNLSLPTTFNVCKDYCAPINGFTNTQSCFAGKHIGAPKSLSIMGKRELHHRSSGPTSFTAACKVILLFPIKHRAQTQSDSINVFLSHKLSHRLLHVLKCHTVAL